MASVVTSPLKTSLVLTHSGWVYTKIKFVENNLIFPGKYLIQLRERPLVLRACYPPPPPPNEEVSKERDTQPGVARSGHHCGSRTSDMLAFWLLVSTNLGAADHNH